MLFCLKFSFKLVTFSKSYTKKTKVGIFSEYSVQMPRVRDQRRKWGIERAKFVRLLDVWVHPVRATSEKRLWLYSPLRWRKSLHARRSGKNASLLYLVISSLFWVSINVVTAHRLIFSCPFFGAKQSGLSHDLRLFWPEIVVWMGFDS